MWTFLRLVLVVGLGIAAEASPWAAQASQTGDAAYYFLLGRHLEGLNRIDEAIAAHKKAMSLEPDSAELRAELAGLYARQDKGVEALEMAESALERDPENHEANRILGSVYAALSDLRRPLRPGDDPSTYPARAIAALELARRDNVFDIGLELTLGRLYVQTGAFAQAVPVLQRVATDQPGFGDAAVLLAAAQEGAGRPAEAIQTLEALLRENPGFFRGQLRVAELYEGQQMWTEAAEAYAKAQALNPRAVALTARRAAALINAGSPDSARELLEQAIDRGGPGAQDPGLLYLLAESFRALDRLDSAEATAKKLLANDPADARGLHVMSLILQQKGDVAGAEKVLRSLIARDPLDANALNSLGYMLAERGERLDEAVDLLKRALAVDPDNPSYLDSLGWAYFQQGRLDLADPPLTQAAATLKESSVVQDHLGDLRFKQQRYGDAAEAWKQALAGDGQDIDRASIEKKIRDARGRMDRE